ncbi:hypothetical protein GWI33_009299 [Rhynchophorus ferrugineus]|uniref:Uncharacterized protein n=1 Tax=Rhynchophorus ferrugineus TaxID=354439 RepID=A0A834IGW5_RHYFE|nr:hypothetical protein GWI33_009299 [Rhynchophorus ferrugineus]
MSLQIRNCNSMVETNQIGQRRIDVRVSFPSCHHHSKEESRRFTSPKKKRKKTRAILLAALINKSANTMIKCNLVAEEIDNIPLAVRFVGAPPSSSRLDDGTGAISLFDGLIRRRGSVDEEIKAGEFIIREIDTCNV